MAGYKRAYLIHGDDHGRIGERRARLRAMAEAESGVQGVEVLEGDAATPEAVAGALAAMTFAFGRRFIVVDGVERWKEADAKLVAPALESADEETTVAFFAREEGRTKVPAGLVEAVKAAGGHVSAELKVKPWDLPKWVDGQARELRMELRPGAAKALVRIVGERQQRLVRELEKLALSLPEGAAIEVEDVEEMAAGSAERKVWGLGDALVGRDLTAATRLYLELRAQGEQFGGLQYTIARRVRQARGVAVRLEAGESPGEVRKELHMPPRAAERFLADIGNTDAERLGHAVITLADVELATRGGAEGVLAEDTRALELIAELAG